jgi:hypothetical protein
MDPKLTDTIDMHVDPLAFPLRQGRGPSPLLGGGRDVIKVEARQMAGWSPRAWTQPLGGSSRTRASTCTEPTSPHSRSASMAGAAFDPAT